MPINFIPTLPTMSSLSLFPHLFHTPPPLPFIRHPHSPRNLPESIIHLPFPSYSFHTLEHPFPQLKLLSSFSMASNRRVTLILFISLLLIAPSLQARKLWSEPKVKVSPLEAGFVLDALPKGTSPPSSPSNGDHKTVNPGTSKGDTQRLLGSVPSPGIGH